MSGASAQRPQQQQGRAVLPPSTLSSLGMWQAETWPLGGALTAFLPYHQITANEQSDFWLLKLLCADKHISAKDHSFKTQVSCFAKHLERAETKAGLEFLVHSQFLNILTPPPPAVINKMKVKDFESSFGPTKIILIFSILELLISN